MTKANRCIAMFFASLATYGGVAGYFIRANTNSPGIVDLLFALIFAVVLYLWYYFDAKERTYKRTTILGGAIIMLPFIAIPYYLFKSRPHGVRVGSILRYIGLAALAFFTVLIIGIIAAII